MLPKSYVVFKWLVYALATLLLFALQSLVLNHVRLFGVTPFLYPMLPAVLSMYEGSRRGPIFSLFLGLVCDLLLPAPFSGFFTLIFPAIALFSSYVAENLLSPSFFCSVFLAAAGLFLTGAGRLLVGLLSGGAYLPLMAEIALWEALLTLPAVVAVTPVYRLVHRRCAADY